MESNEEEMMVAFGSAFPRGTEVELSERGLWRICDNPYERNFHLYVYVFCGSSRRPIPLMRIYPKEIPYLPKDLINLTKYQADKLGLRTTDHLIAVPTFGVTFWRKLERQELIPPSYIEAKLLFPGKRILARDFVILNPKK